METYWLLTVSGNIAGGQRVDTLSIKAKGPIWKQENLNEAMGYQANILFAMPLTKDQYDFYNKS